MFDESVVGPKPILSGVFVKEVPRKNSIKLFRVVRVFDYPRRDGSIARRVP